MLKAKMRGAWPEEHLPAGCEVQDSLAEIYTGSQFGSNFGGPLDFVTPVVGEQVTELPETKELSTVSLGIKQRPSRKQSKRMGRTRRARRASPGSLR